MKKTVPHLFITCCKNDLDNFRKDIFMNAFNNIKLRLLAIIIVGLSILACGGTKKNVEITTTDFQVNQLSLLEENVKSNPTNPEVHFRLAQAYSDLDSLNLAMESIKKCLEINPDYNDAKLLNSSLLLKKNQIKQAYLEFLEILDSEDGVEFVSEIRDLYGKPYPIYKLTSGEFNNAFPCFSPDDRRIVFQSDRDGNWEIYLMDVDGTQENRLTNNSSQDEMPVIGSKENLIAFTSTRDDTAKKLRAEKKRNIFLMDLNTSKVVREIAHEADDWYPALSDKARQIVFVSERDDSRDVPFQDRFSDIYFDDIKKNQLLRLTQNEADDGSPAISSNGKWIIFTSNRTGSFQIFKMDTRGKLVEQLTDLKGNCGSPHFSHDGKKITFFANIFGSHDIFTMDNNGKNIARLTHSPFQDGYPNFSSDKRKIIFHSNRSGKYQIYWIDLMNPLNHDELMDELEDAINLLD